MKTMLTEKRIGQLRPRAGSFDVYDLGQPGLVVRVRPSGVRSYLAALGRGRWLTLGRPEKLPLDDARKVCRAKLVAQEKGADPIAERRAGRGLTFAQFLTERYRPWAVANRKTGQGAVDRLTTHFGPLFGAKPLGEITSFAVERWRSGRLKGEHAVTAGTVNRDLAEFKAALSKAVEWGLLSEHPLRRVKLARTDRNARVRFLTNEEEARLRAVLAARDEKYRTERAHANAWRRERHYPELPTFGTYTDHLTPMVLLALNTGCRRGELFGLRWGDVDLVHGNLTVRGEGAKSGRTRHVPLNAEAVDALKAWQPEQPEADGLVFPGDDGAKLTTLKTAWLAVAKAAKLADFRFHDLRHSFASHLVQRGVSLAVVRELLGHSDFALTLRYAHLAAADKAAAVATLAR